MHLYILTLDDIDSIWDSYMDGLSAISDHDHYTVYPAPINIAYNVVA